MHPVLVVLASGDTRPSHRGPGTCEAGAGPGFTLVPLFIPRLVLRHLVI